MGKGSATTSTSTSNAADPQAAQAYRDILQRAQGVASTPYQAYSGPLTADVNSQQNLGIAGINSNAGFASPYIQQAASLAGASTGAVTPGQIQQYLNPYTQNVVDATTQQLQHDNAQQMAQLQGNQISQGALGGNATGVAKGILAGQQGRTLASTTAGLYQQGYGQALQAAQQQQQTGLAGANALANYGISGQGAALAGAGQQINAGTLQQQTEQQRLNSLYQQYAQAQAFPYQQTQWLAGVDTGIGTNLGGTSSGSTTGPAPNIWSQILGGGLTAAGAAGGLGWKPFAAAGGAIRGYAEGGGVGGVPWAGGVGWIPAMTIHGGAGAPQGRAPSSQTPQQFDAAKLVGGLGSLKGKAGGLGDAGIGDGSWYGPSSVGGAPLSGFENQFYGPGFAGGGGVDNVMGGDPGWTFPDVGSGYPQRGVAPLSFEERAAPAAQALASGDFDPQGANSTEFHGTPGMQASNAGLVPIPMARPEGAGAPVVASDDEDGETPTGVAGPSGAPRSGGVAAFAPEGPGSYGAMPDAVTAPRSGAFGIKGLSSNVPTGLMAAGLGMLASRSPFFGNAVGEGGLAGLSAYGSAEEQDRKVVAEAAKLSREARKQFLDETMGNRKQTETERHNKATESKEALSRIPTGMRLSKSGELENIPGFVKSKQDQVKAGMVGSTMDDETAEFLADRVAMGDTKALVGLGRGAQGAENLSKINSIVARKAREGVPVSDAARTILQNAAQQQGLIAAERTQANIMAKLSVYGRTAFNATDIAERLSGEVPRTQFMPVNKIINAAREKTGDPKIVALGQALMTLTNEYARAIGGGHGTVHDKEAAEKRLSAAQTHDQLKAVIDVMRQEILAEERAMPAARKHIRDIYNPTSGGPRGTSIAGEHGAPPPPGPVSGASGFPAGAIPRQFNGKTYYYDPVTKQPFPGQ